MKHSALLLLAPLLLVPATAPAQDYINGMAARAVIGQKTFTAQDVKAPATLPDLFQPGIGQWLLGASSSVAYANGMLFIVDSNNIGASPNNNRVLIYYDVKKVVPDAKASIPVQSNSSPVLCPVCTGVFNYQFGKAGTVLGQPDFDSTDFGRTRSSLRTPTSVASDGKTLAVTDTQNNRILIWLTIPGPGQNNAPADVVLGAPDFTSLRQGVLDNKSVLGPQGVWIQDGRLFVADTRNHRVLVWNSIPTKNDTPADFVLGQKDFNTTSEQFVGQPVVQAAANRLKNPVSVTSDGKRLFVADLGYNRVLIWSTIPTSTDVPADIVLGEPDMNTDGYDSTGRLINNTTLCKSAGVDPNQNNTTVYPPRCEATLNFPRYVLSDGKRLYVADGGNDRVLIWNTIPVSNGQGADVVLGQPDALTDAVTDTSGFFTPNLTQGAPNTTRTPTGLAWDGSNLYVATPYDRRVMVFTPGVGTVPSDGVNNGASLKVYALGVMNFAGTIQANDKVEIVINNSTDTTTARTYDVIIKASDTLATVIANVAAAINGAPDPYVIVRQAANGSNTLLFSARQSGTAGNSVTVTTTVTNTSTGTAAAITVAGGTPTGGGSADTVAPGGIIEIDGAYLADQTAGLPADVYVGTDSGPNGLPTDLGGVEVYVDGNRLPLFYVSPTRIVAQLPYKLSNTSASNLYVRTVLRDGTVYVSTAVSLPISPENPGIFALSGDEPRKAVAFHGSSYATGTILIDGATATGDAATVTIDDRNYTYTAVANDTNAQVRDKLIALINANADEKVTAVAGGTFTRIRLFAKVAGPAGDGIKIAATAATSSTSATTQTAPGVTMNQSRVNLCCANVEGAPVTDLNPAVSGETIKIYATGLGDIKDLSGIQLPVQEGVPFNGPAINQPIESVSSFCGGSTANVLSDALKPGMIGIHEVVLELNSSLASNSQTQCTISQYIYTSNIATIPVANRTEKPTN